MGLALITSAGLALLGNKEPHAPHVIEARQTRIDQSARHTDSDAVSKAASASTAVSVLPLRSRQAESAQTASHRETSLFQAQSWAQAPAAAAITEQPPQAPPLTLTYLGILEDDKQRIDKVLLADGEKTHMVAVNDVIDDQYKVVSITRQAIVLEFLPLRQQQTLSTQ